MVITLSTCLQSLIVFTLCILEGKPHRLHYPVPQDPQTTFQPHLLSMPQTSHIWGPSGCLSLGFPWDPQAQYAPAGLPSSA